MFLPCIQVTKSQLLLGVPWANSIVPMKRRLFSVFSKMQPSRHAEHWRHGLDSNVDCPRAAHDAGAGTVLRWARSHQECSLHLHAQLRGAWAHHAAVGG